MKNILPLFLSFFLFSVSFGQSKPAASTKNYAFILKLSDWQLVDYQYGPQAKKKKALTTCDTTLKWKFYTDQNTKRNVLICSSNDGCEDFGFESEWIIKDANLTIKRTKIMGFGGVSASGTFKVLELTSNRMVLEFQKNKYIFKR